MANPASGTPPTQIRLTDADKVKVREIQERFGLPSMASAIRYAVETVHRELNPTQPKPRKPSVRQSSKS